RTAHDLGPVPEDRKAGEREPRVPLVRVVHADECARAARGSVGERGLLAEDDASHTARGQRVRYAHAVDSATHHHDVGRLGHPGLPEEGYRSVLVGYLIMC